MDSTLAIFQSLESAAFAAWPSRQDIDFQGWILRLDRGYTKRANSINATLRSRPLGHADVAGLEARYRDLGLAPTFRLTSFTPSEETDRLLQARGYRTCDPSLVMRRSLADAEFGSETSVAPDRAAWLDAYEAASGKPAADREVHSEILDRIMAPCAWGVHSDASPTLSCGLGVLVEDHLGLFDIATRQDHRRRGLARRQCEGLLAWGARRGARTAFLQVVAANAPAVRLYEQLGFETAYRYWYRVADT